jgi:hypothetical protein
MVFIRSLFCLRQHRLAFFFVLLFEDHIWCLPAIITQSIAAPAKNPIANAMMTEKIIQVKSFLAAELTFGCNLGR